MPLQSNLETTDKMARFIEDELKKEKSNITQQMLEKAIKIYYNVIPENEKPDFAQFFIQLHQDISPTEKKN
jgi:hypothetical protein